MVYHTRHQGYLGYISLFSLCLIYIASAAPPSELKIGLVVPDGLERIGGVTMRYLTQLAVDEVNSDTSILPNTKLTLVAESSGDKASTPTALSAVKKVVDAGVVALVGPAFSTESMTAAPLLNQVQIPYLTPWGTNDQLSSKDRYLYFGRTVPADGDYALSLLVLFEHFKWRRYGLLYGTSEYSISAMAKFEFEAQQRGWVQLGRAQFPDTGELDLSKFKSAGVRVIIIHSDTIEDLERTLAAAKKNGMDTKSYAYVLTESLAIGLETRSDTYREQYAGFLLMRTRVDPSNLQTSLVNKFQSLDPAVFPGAGSGTTPGLVPFMAAEGVYAIANGLDNLFRTNPDASFTPTAVTSSVSKSPAGPDLLAAIRRSEYIGVTGRVRFDQVTGDRIMMPMDVMNVRSNGSLAQIGTIRDGAYTSQDTVIFLQGSTRIPHDLEALAGRKLRAVTAEYEPWIVKDPLQTGNAMWSGIVPDMLAVIADRVGFEYDLVEYNGSWTQMSRDVGAGQYDLIAANMLITQDRQTFSSFSTAFYAEGLALIISPRTIGKDFGLFLRPFHWTMWIAVLIMPVAVAHVLWASEKWGYRPPKETDPADPVMTSTRHSAMSGTSMASSFGASSQRSGKFSGERVRRGYFAGLVDTLYFSYSSFFGTQEGSRLGSSTAQVFSLIWLFSTVVIVASYTANVTAVLTNQRLRTEKVQSKDDLAARSIKVGVEPGDLIEQMVYSELNRQGIDCGGYLECFAAVQRGDVDVYIQLDSFQRYWTRDEPYCGLTTTGRPFRQMTSAFMFPLNWEFISDFDKGLVSILADGTTNEILSQYMDKGVTCPKVSFNEPIFLTMEDVGGLFVFLFVVILFTLLCATGMHFHRKHKQS